MNLERRTRTRLMALGLILMSGLILMLGSTDSVWAGPSQQTIPTVTATLNGGLPPATLPDGLAPVESPTVQPVAIDPANYFLPVGCCLLCCLASLIPAGIGFNLWARRRQKSEKP